MLHYAAANRDEEVFGNNADDFDISRAPNPHVAFGFGEHFCLGAGLGRLQLRIFFEDFLTRFSSVELIGEPLRFRNTNVNGIKQLLLKVS
jgi:cytochrome P450